jgi:AmmeMemoRadiSam system protein A
MKELLKLARQTIEHYFSGKSFIVSPFIKKKYSDKQACFITLKIKKKLRGCIGSIYPRHALWQDVIDNSLNAAFHDSRFLPVKKEEMKKIKIEVSVLTIPKKIEYNSIDELKRKISHKGVILRGGYNSATYLPQVWKEIPSKVEFLSSLCQKAGLSSNSWKSNSLDFWVYSVKKISE